MIPGRLYFKIFLSFIGVLVIAMFLVAGLFKHTEGRKFTERFKRIASAQVLLVRSVVEDHARANDWHSEDMRELLDRLGNAYMAKIWITDSRGDLLAASFEGPLPTPPELAPEDPDDDQDDWHHKWTKDTNFTVVDCGEGPHCIYVTFPFGGGDVEPGVIHYYYRDDKITAHEKFFILGLIGICIVIALLVMPISLFITRRLNALRHAAHRIADGDLSHRADICGKDEVAKVGRALNHMADSLSRMIRGSKELTANVSHELRTPLTRMRIAEEMLRQRFGDQGAAHLDSIREDIDALDQLIGRLLDLSKLDLREAPFTLEEVDPAEMIQSIVDNLTPIADHQGVTITTDLPDTPPIQAHGDTLYTALANILENGVKHADPDGQLHVAITTQGNQLVITAENTHPPLTDDELITIFEPFRRAKGARPTGTGLGLAIAAKAIERHHGTLHAENTDNGVRFVVKLDS